MSIVGVVTFLTSNQDYILETGGADQSDGGAFALDQRIGGNRGAMEQPGNRLRLTLRLAKQPCQTLYRPIGQVFGGGQHFLDANRTAVINRQEVGKRATNFDTHFHGESGAG